MPQNISTIDPHRLVDEWFRRYAAIAAENVSLSVKLEMAMERIAAMEAHIQRLTPQEPEPETKDPSIFGQSAEERANGNSEIGVRVAGNGGYSQRPD